MKEHFAVRNLAVMGCVTLQEAVARRLNRCILCYSRQKSVCTIGDFWIGFWKFFLEIVEFSLEEVEFPSYSLHDPFF